MTKSEMESYISNISLIKSLQHNPTKKNANHILSMVSHDDYAMIIDNNVDTKTRILKMISMWLDGGNNTDKDVSYYTNLIEKIKASSYQWFNQSTLATVNANDVISMLKHEF